MFLFFDGGAFFFFFFDGDALTSRDRYGLILMYAKI
jgi:hypothetical protein